MSNWFECKVKYSKVDEKGVSKRVTDTYLVDALSFSEAESRVIEELKPFIKGEFNILGMKMAAVNEIYPCDEGDRWYKCKVSFITVDEVKGTEKKVSSNILVFGSDIASAWTNLNKALADTMADYEVTIIAETPIVDIFPYGNSKEEQEMRKKPVVLKYDNRAEDEDIMSTFGSSSFGNDDDEEDELGNSKEEDDENKEDGEDEGPASQYEFSVFEPEDDPFGDEAMKAAMADFEKSQAEEETKKKK